MLHYIIHFGDDKFTPGTSVTNVCPILSGANAIDEFPMILTALRNPNLIGCMTAVGDSDGFLRNRSII